MNKDIDKAAREYAVSRTCTQYHCDKRHYIACGEHGRGCEKARDYYEAHIAGSQSRQSEIDELTRELEGSHRMEEIARQTLLRKRSKVDELIKALEEIICVWNMPVSDRCKPYAKTMNDAIHKATQLLEKYGKK